VRVVLDTNILISALISPGAAAWRLFDAWRAARFILITSEEQLDEFRKVTRYPQLRNHIRPSEAGAMLNEIRLLATVLPQPPEVDCSSDPADNFLLALACAGDADYLVTGDRRGVLALRRYGRTGIVTLRSFLDILGC
jgi:putative PIN family toxin of toxin-antitoxin system